ISLFASAYSTSESARYCATTSSALRLSSSSITSRPSTASMRSSTSSFSREVIRSIASRDTFGRNRTRISVFDESDSLLPGSVSVCSRSLEICEVRGDDRCQSHLCNRPANAAIRIKTSAMERLSQRLRDMIACYRRLHAVIAALKVYQTQLPRGCPIFVTIATGLQMNSPARRDHLGAHLIFHGGAEGSVGKVSLRDVSFRDFVFVQP